MESTNAKKWLKVAIAEEASDSIGFGAEECWEEGHLIDANAVNQQDERENVFIRAFGEWGELQCDSALPEQPNCLAFGYFHHAFLYSSKIYKVHIP